MLTGRLIFNTSTCFSLVFTNFIIIFMICFYCLLRFTSWSLGCRGRCDPQPLHNRFTCSSLKVGLKLISTTGATYLILQVCGGTSLSVGLTFVLNLSYLLAGYWSASCSMYFKTLLPLRYNGLEYDVSWTMPQCVLCLRLIG